MNMHSPYLAAAVLMGVILCAGCGSRRTTAAPPPVPVATTPVNQQGGMFSDFGTLASDDGAWVVKTTLRSVSLVDYEICNASTGKILAQAGGFSHAMRWFMFWDSENQLWVHNSDMGPFQVWTHNGTAFVAHKLSAGDPLLETMPDAVKDALPNSTARHLGLKQ